MPKTIPAHKPGIHLMKNTDFIRAICKEKSWYWWQVVARNGQVVATSKRTYTRKGNAVKSIKAAAMLFKQARSFGATFYYDHSKTDSPLKSYL